MYEFILYWLDGTLDRVKGENIADAIRRAGYGHGAIVALDFYDYAVEGEEPRWYWNKAKHDWKLRELEVPYGLPISLGGRIGA
jgi:hypothetical protein